eukprot:5306-Heterococcus_DN1.PRE.2
MQCFPGAHCTIATTAGILYVHCSRLAQCQCTPQQHANQAKRWHNAPIVTLVTPKTRTLRDTGTAAAAAAAWQFPGGTLL